MNEINFRINDIKEIKMTMDVGVKEIYPPIENLEVTPSKEQQVFTHENSYGYDKVTVSAIPEIKLQTKEVTPTKELQVVGVDEEYDGLDEVVVEPIPDEYIIPDGTLDVNANGDVDVTMFKMARVGVYTPPKLQDKSITITENGTRNITYDKGYDGLNSVEVTTNIESSGSSAKITNLAELDDAIENCANALISYYDECIRQYPCDTNEPATLYSPAVGFNSYVIRYRNNGYQVLWFSDMIIRQRNNTEFNTLVIQLTNLYIDYNGVKGIKKWNDSTFVDDTTPAYISSTTFSTLQDAINGMKDNTITYTSSNAKNWGVQYANGVVPIPYTNMAYLGSNYDVIMTTRRISSNEIIEVI